MHDKLAILALNQTLFNKKLIVGQGFSDGQQTFPDMSFDFVWHVFVNGNRYY